MTQSNTLISINSSAPTSHLWVFVVLLYSRDFCTDFKRREEFFLKSTETLSSHDETGYAVGNAGACCQESDAHDDVRDSQGVADHSHLRGRHRVRADSSGVC